MGAPRVFDDDRGSRRGGAGKEYFRSVHHGKYGGIPVDTRSVKLGGRFSKNDITPSFASADEPRTKIPRLSILCASIGWSAPSIFQNICRMSATETWEVLSAISCASARAAGKSSSGLRTLLTSPPSSASWAENTLPLQAHSSACEIPTN